MSSLCEWLHNVLEPLPLIRYSFENTPMPDNGIYFFYEEGEFLGHGSKLQRIVRVGTHRDGNFRQRIASHFLINSNLMNFNANSAKPSDRSIFRKNIGRALLNRAHDPYLEVWEIDFTSHEKKQLFGHRRNIDKEKEIEEDITAILRKNFTFRFIEVEGQQKRMGTEGLESKLIGTLASCPNCTPSTNWLGLKSPVKKIARSGLWLVQHLKSPSMSEADKDLLVGAIEKTRIKYGKKVYISMFDARDVEDYRLAFEENRLLNIVACSRAKIWNEHPADTKAYPARVAYRGGMFKQALRCFLDLKDRKGNEPRWLILSAKYGLLEPDEEIADYNVAFSAKSDKDKVIRQEILERQWKDKQLDRYNLVFVWAGKAYADRVREILKSSGLPGAKLICPAAWLSIGKALGVLKNFREALVGSRGD